MKEKYWAMTKAELIQALEALEARRLPASNAGRRPPAAPGPDYEQVLHDLRVHQEELEQQNQALREAQGLLEESRNRYTELYDLAPLGYVTLDRQSVIQEINLTGARLLGIERSTLVGKPFIRRVLDTDRPAFYEHLRACLAGVDVCIAELHIVRPDGTTLDVELHSVPIHQSAGLEPGYFTALIDISARKRAEDARMQAEAEVRRLNRDLEKHATELAVANHELESFSYSVSHDLRAPLAQINTLLHTLVEDYSALLPDDGRYSLDLIRQNVLAMNHLIEDLLSFSRASRLPLKKQLVSTADIIREVLANMDKGGSPRAVDVVGDLPPCQADPALLTQVWVNLLSNAFKFTSRRAGPRVEIGSLVEDGERVYFVKDNGVGFDAEHADRLFQVFQRFHSEEEYPGTGVGLAIVERIVRRHGGRVWAESQPDHGATFYFTIP